VPQISSFYGITIWIYYDESHHPGHPHFHARYGEAEASIGIDRLVFIAGELPPRAKRLVAEWAAQHQAELRENWERARKHQALLPIEPLS
jgi:uncharacterized protein DUF4160